MKLIGNNERCLLYLFPLEFEPNLISFSTAPRVVRARLMQQRLRTWIQIQWTGPLKLIVNDVVTDIELPEQVVIPGYRCATVREIVNSTSPQFYLLFHYYNEEQYIQIPDQANDILNPPIHHLLPIKNSPPRYVYYTPHTSPIASVHPYQQVAAQLRATANANSPGDHYSTASEGNFTQPSAPGEFDQRSPPPVQRLLLKPPTITPSK